MHAGMKRVAAGAVMVLGIVVASTGTARADGQGDGWVDSQSGEIGAGADSGGQSDGADPASGGSGSRPTCTYSAVDEEVSHAADSLAEEGWGQRRGSEPGAWYRRICVDADGRSSGTIVWVATGVDPTALAEQALDRANVPLPDVRFNPSPPQDLVVNLETWLWLDNFAPVEASASAGPVTVTVTAAPSSVRWSMGNGDEIVCPTGGTAYDPNRSPDAQHTDCSYTYRRSSASAPDGRFTVTATVTWDVTWTATGIAAGGDLGQLSRTTTTRVRVAEVQAVHQ
jgi:hypothetical protein